MEFNVISIASAYVSKWVFFAGDPYVDSGATATDNRDGNLTAQLTSWGVAAIDTTLPTPPFHPYILAYGVRDSAQNQAIPVYRKVSVVCRQVTLLFLPGSKNSLSSIINLIVL